jgi:hypothetical protein
LSVDDQRAIDAAIDQFEAQQLCITFVGEIKVGKSTVINALLGGAHLETDVVECTAAPTLVRSVPPGSSIAPGTLRVTDTAGVVTRVPIETLREATTLVVGNPHLKVERAELFVAEGVVAPCFTLVDTPGLNGTPELGARTLRQLALAHVAVFVTALDRGLGIETDIEALKQAERAAGRLLVVFNKGDVVAAKGADPDAAKREVHRLRANFITRLREAGIDFNPADIFVLSGRLQLIGYEDHPYAPWLREEFRRFEDALEEGIREDWRAEQLRDQPRKVIARIAAGVERDLTLRIQSIQAPALEAREHDLRDLEEQQRSLRQALERLLRQSERDAVDERAAMNRLIDDRQRQLQVELRQTLEQVADALLNDEDRAAVFVSRWLREQLDKTVLVRVRNLYGAMAERLHADIGAYVQGGFKLNIPGARPIDFDAGQAQRSVQAAFDQRLSETRRSTEDAKLSCEAVKREVEALQAKLARLRPKRETLAGLRKSLAAEIATRDALGKRPASKTKYRRETRERTVSRRGFFGWVKDKVFGREVESYDVDVPYQDDSAGKAWDSKFGELDQRVEDLEKKVAEHATVETEQAKLTTALDQKRLELERARKRYDREVALQNQVHQAFLETSLEARRQTLLTLGVAEIERSIEDVKLHLLPQFSALLGQLERAVEQDLGKQVETAIAQAEQERLASLEEQDVQLRESRIGIEAALIVKAALERGNAPVA